MSLPSNYKQLAATGVMPGTPGNRKCFFFLVETHHQIIRIQNKMHILIYPLKFSLKMFLMLLKSKQSNKICAAVAVLQINLSFLFCYSVSAVTCKYTHTRTHTKTPFKFASHILFTPPLFCIYDETSKKIIKLYFTPV